MASGSVPPRFFFKERFEAISNYEGNNVGILAMSAMGKGCYMLFPICMLYKYLYILDF